MPHEASAEPRRALFNTEVAEGRWKGVRLKNLPRGAAIRVQVEATSPIAVMFVHHDQVDRFPAGARPEFLGTVERRLSFAVAVPRSGNYYVILDNRRGDEQCKVRLLIEAEAPPS